MSLNRTESASINSRQDSTLFSNLNDSTLIKIVDDIERRFQLLLLENEILEKFLKRNDPHAISELQQSVDSLKRKTLAFQLSSQAHGVDSSILMSKTMLISMSMTRSDLFDSNLLLSSGAPKEIRNKININEKIEMVLFEIDQFRNEIARLQSNAVKIEVNYGNQLDELNARLEFITSEENNFQQFLDKKRLTIEKFIRYLQDNLKKSLIYIGKIHLNTNSLKIERAKLIKKLDNRQNLRRTLCAADFDQLNIQNRELRQQLETIKVPHENQLKRLINETNLKLNKIKLNMESQQNEIMQTSDEIKQKSNQCEKIRMSIKTVLSDNEILVDKIKKLRTLRDIYKVPDIFHLLNLKMNLEHLKDECKIFERKNSIQKSIIQRTKQKVRKSQINW